MTVASAVIKATDVRVGDRVRARSGVELTVTRIDEAFMGRADMLAFVEDSEAQWFKMPAPRDGDVDPPSVAEIVPAARDQVPVTRSGSGGECQPVRLHCWSQNG